MSAVIRWLRVGALLLTLLALAGCRVDTTVRVTLRDDGSGTISTSVALDAEAVAQVEQNGRTLETAIVVDDLAEAGWRIDPWVRDGQGGATLKLSHTFVGESQLSRRLEDLAGTTGALGGGRVIRERSFLRSRDELSVDADLGALAAAISNDPELVTSLQAAGLDPAGLEQQLTAQLRDAFRLRVSVAVPGGRVDSTRLVAGEHRRVTAAHKTFDAGRLSLLVMAGLIAFLAALLYLSASISARRDRSRRRAALLEPERTPLM